MSINQQGHTRIGIVKHNVLLDYAFANGREAGEYDRGATEVYN